MFVNQQTPLTTALTKVDQETIPGEVLDLEIQIEKYLNAKRSEGLSPGTIRFYRRCLTKFSKFCGTRAITSIAQIDRDEIRGYMNWLQDLGLNPGGRHGHYRSVRAFLYWWYAEQDEPSWWRIPYDRKTLKAPKLPEKALDPVSMVDFERLIETCKGRRLFTDVRDFAILHTLLSSGVRASELCRLKVSQVDLTTGIVRVKSGKGAKDRTTIINSTAKKAIRHWLRRRGLRDGPLFTTDEEGQPTYWGLREIIRRRSKKAGVKQPELHSFRRAFTLAQLSAGVPERTVKRLLGHADSSNLIHVYAKQVTKHLMEAYSDPLDGGW